MKRMRGIVIELHRNYGVLETEDETPKTFPFELTSSMMNETDTEISIKVPKKVTFAISRPQGLREKNQTKVAKELRPIGEEIFEKVFERVSPYLTRVRQEFKKYNIEIPNEYNADADLYEWLKSAGFQPRMLDYLQEGIFLSKDLMKIYLSNNGLEERSFKPFNISDIVRLDAVDKTFRNYLLKWIVGLEDVTKSLISRLSSKPEGKLVGEKAIDKWRSKNNKGQRQFTKAKSEKMFRPISDAFDYVNTNSVPIEDLMHQIDLMELPEFISVWRAASDETPVKVLSPWLEFLSRQEPLIRDLTNLRNASAHGRPVIPSIADPDYNPNWDLEIDDTSTVKNLHSWTLYPYLLNEWQERGVEKDDADVAIETVFGNPLRRAWVELNYLYAMIVPILNEKEAHQFFDEANWFLSYKDTDFENDTLHLRLKDMGDITHFEQTNMPPVYRVIANEAFDVWNSVGKSVGLGMVTNFMQMLSELKK